MRGIVAWRPALAFAGRIVPENGLRLTSTGSIAVGGNVTNSTITTTVNQENPATLALLAKTCDKNASEEKRGKPRQGRRNWRRKLGFTSSAVNEFSKLLGEQSVPDEKVRIAPD